MSPPRNSLQAVLDQHAAHPQATPVELLAVEPSIAKPISEKFYRPSREGRKLIGGHFDPKTAKQLKLLAAEDETTVQALLEEALDLLFVKKGRAAITK